MDNPKKDTQLSNEEQANQETPKQLSNEEQAYMDFVKKHRSRCVMWAQAHGNVNFPIIRLPDGSYKWLNRAERSKARHASKR